MRQTQSTVNISTDRNVENACLNYKRTFVCPTLDVHRGYLGRGLIHTDLIDCKDAFNEIHTADRLNRKKNVFDQYCLSRAQMNLRLEHDVRSTLKQIGNITGRFRLSGSFDGHFCCGVALDDLSEYTTALQEFGKALQCRLNE